MKAFTSFDQLLETVREEKPKEAFSAIVSNPPYQMEAGTSAPPSVYQHFANVSFLIGKKVSLIHPARWMLGGTRGEGLDEFRAMLSKSPHISNFIYIREAANLFPNASIASGLSIYLMDFEKVTGKIRCNFDGVEIIKSKLLEDDESFIVTDQELYPLIKKIRVNRTLSELISARNPYGDELSGTREIEKIPESENGIETYYINGTSLSKKRIDRNIVKVKIDDWKVGVSKTAYRGNFLYPHADRIFVMEPGQICTGTFHKYGSFKSRDEAVNAIKFYKTTFTSFLIGIRIPAHIMSRHTYSAVPLVDFSTGEILDKPGVFIDFSKPETLDDQLAEIYNLSEAERTLMAKGLRPWKDKNSVTSDM